MSIVWKCCFKDISQRKVLENVLPQQYSYKVIAYQLIESAALISESKFSATIQINICDVKDVQEFIDDFSDITSTAFNIGSNSDGKNTKKFKLSGSRKCIHNVQKRGYEQRKDRSAGQRWKEFFLEWKG